MSKAEREFFETVTKERKYDVFPDAFYKGVLRKTIESLQRKSVIIDIGSGTGAWSMRIAKMGYVVINIDISMSMIKNAYRFFKDSRVDFFGVCGDAENLPLRDSTFDCAFYGFSLHHIPNVSSALRESSRCLKPRSFIILIEPNGSNPIRRLSASVGRLFGRTKSHYFSSPSERPLSINFVCQLLRACKFNNLHVSMDYTILKSEKTNVVMTLRNLLLRIASKLFSKPCNAVNFIVIAERAQKTCAHH